MAIGGSKKVVHAACLSTSRTDERYIPALRYELKRKCVEGYEGVDFEAELADMKRDSRRLPHPEYLALGLSHRFCLVATGDFVSTHKASAAGPTRITHRLHTQGAAAHALH